MSEQSSGCSACKQLGQVPTPEHLAGVARFEARQQAATNAESLEAENARLRALTTTLLEWKVCARHADQVAVATARAERAETFLPTLLTKWIGREDPPGLERFWCRECGYHWWKNAPEDHATACIVGKVRAALAEGA